MVLFAQIARIPKCIILEEKIVVVVVVGFFSPYFAIAVVHLYNLLAPTIVLLPKCDIDDRRFFLLLPFSNKVLEFHCCRNAMAHKINCDKSSGVLFFSQIAVQCANLTGRSTKQNAPVRLKELPGFLINPDRVALHIF